MMRVLIVENVHKIANALRRGLQQEGYNVDVGYDAKDGLALLLSAQLPYQVVIIDSHLSGPIDGIRVIKEMRKAKNHTPVILLMSNSQAKQRVEVTANGADDYLLKPFSLEQLLSKIRGLVNPLENQQNSLLTYADLALDSDSYQVSRLGKRIKLSHREFGLLEYMLRNAEKILTKDRIIAHVWDYDADVLPNTVEVYIRYLRNKIDKPFPDEARLIHTIRGFGYKLSSDN